MVKSSIRGVEGRQEGGGGKRGVSGDGRGREGQQWWAGSGYKDKTVRVEMRVVLAF